MESSLIRLVRRLFATTPRVYLATLKILQRGSPEKRLYISILRKGDVVIDAGANVGYFTMLFSDLVGASGWVHAFEPVPATFSLLSKNLQRFPHYTNVSLNCAALGDGDRKTKIFLPNGDHGQAALVYHRDGSWRNAKVAPIDIEMTRLDRYAQGLDKIDLLKCDVEGAELLVLRGAESILRRFRPKVFLEVNERWTGSFGWSPKDVIDFLRSVGYKHFYCIEPGTGKIEKERFSGSALLSTWEEMRGLA
jgi:FkbM family methyltransferase